MNRNYAKASLVCFLITATSCFAAAAPVPNEDAVRDIRTMQAHRLAEAIRREVTENEALTRSATGQNAVVFLGETGAGKSTLVNLLTGIDLVANPQCEYALPPTASPGAMPIGGGGRSVTVSPKYIDKNGLRFFDMPGLGDTEGTARDLVNAAFIKKILTEAASVKFVIVASVDQFGVRRGAYVTDIFKQTKDLFITAGQENPIDRGTFVVTKTPRGDSQEALLGKIGTHDQRRQAFHGWLQARINENGFHLTKHARDETNNQPDRGVLEAILRSVENAPPTKIAPAAINTDALFRADVKAELKGMFLCVASEKLDGKLGENPETLARYDAAIADYERLDFIERFGTELREKDAMVKLLTDFTAAPYQEAIAELKAQKTPAVQARIATLRTERAKRADTVKADTERSLNEAIASKTPKLAMDFAYHKDYYEAVVGEASIDRIALDDKEKEMARATYVDFMARHSESAMKRWYETKIKPEHDGQLAALRRESERQEEQHRQEIRALTGDQTAQAAELATLRVAIANQTAQAAELAELRRRFDILVGTLGVGRDLIGFDHNINGSGIKGHFQVKTHIPGYAFNFNR